MSDDKQDPQNPERRQVQRPIPSNPANPELMGEVDKVVVSEKPAANPDDPSPVSTGIGSGPTLDPVGGAGLGQSPGESRGGKERPATTRDRDVKAVDQQDRTGKA